jgi:hypothetical protein
MIKAVVSALLAVSLAGCGLQQGLDPRSASQRTLDTLNIAYIAAAVGVDTYAMLRTCGDGVQAPCSDLNLVTQLRQASAAVRAALDAAQSVITTVQSDATSQQKSLQIVRDALLALTSVMAEYRLTRS